MRIPFSPASLLIAGAVSLLSACASAPRADAEAQSVQVYELNPFVGRSYDVVGRLWTGPSRSALGVQTYPSRDEAIAAMRMEATRINADALVNVSCVDQRGSTWLRSNDSAFLCYGVAIQLRRT